MNEKEFMRATEIAGKCSSTIDVKEKLLEFRHKNQADPTFDETWQILNDLYDSYKKQI